MDIKRTSQWIHKASCSIAVSLRIFVIALGITLSPLGITFSNCECFACDCSEIEAGCCCGDSQPSSCCSSDGCRVTCNDEANHDSCVCHPCQCDLGIAVDPISIPGIVDAEDPLSKASPEFPELIPAVRSIHNHIDRREVLLSSNLHVVYCRWLI